ncbi:hypothetical protein GUJ93_ZPchr0012g20439 [Zizania palustris]|uniref:DYW domain-containing protein n=1 Tax=Zizania palustris TaxID=103762 RepID=A0A8J5WS62_ZIZPA|nr:hypothetical protein GUJ93_ZPchr0012g20439 [Zizania palustris]
MAMEMVVRMQEDGKRPDSVTLASVLPACAKVHAFVLRAGLDELVNVSTAILDAYCKRGDVGEQGQSSIGCQSLQACGCRLHNNVEKKGLQKTPGWSIIQLKNEVHTFYSGSTNHQHAKEIYSRLAKLIEEIKTMGYVPDTDLIHDDVEDDVNAQLLNAHSEKLAIAFGLIRIAPGTTIQINKNLSHNATKLISLVTGREIVMRDIQRFHHFKDGKCSFGDYWQRNVEEV